VVQVSASQPRDHELEPYSNHDHVNYIWHQLVPGSELEIDQYKLQEIVSQLSLKKYF
jgi:hypothetical protein